MTNLTGSNLNRREATGPKGEGRDSPSTFPKYPEYKDSGVEWLGEVPAHWDIKPLKYVATYNDEVLSESTPDDYPIKYVEISDVDEQLGIKNWSEHSFSSAPSRARRILRDGDVLISTVRTYLRAIAPVVEPPENLVGSTGFAAIRPMRGVYHSGLLGYALRAEWFISNIIARSVGVSYPAINASDLVALLLPLPPWKEQQAIAAFLDHETARIDALVEEQQRLIELLKEKRQAVISHAVTKGLDPDVPMRDSGVEWLGEVPAHWEVRKISYDFTAVKGPRGALLTKEYCAANPGTYPVYSGQTDNAGVLGYIDDFDFSLGSNGGLLTTTVGAKAMSLNFVKNKISLSQNCMLIKPSSKDAFIKFYFYHLQPLFKLERGMIPDHMQPSFRMEDLYSFYVAFPPLKEQEEIAQALDDEMGKLDALGGEASHLIERLKERRSALISAAVTGKIDVRGWQPPTGSTVPEATQAEMV